MMASSTDSRLAILNVVGLTRRLLGDHSPHLRRLVDNGQLQTIRPAFPAVTCTAQANYLTGKLPSEHGIVGNGWYHRELAEVQFWRQPDHLIRAPKIWETLRSARAEFSCARLFWWYNMYSTVDVSLTPRPMYPADGRKVFDIYTHPDSIRHDIQRELGPFPFPAFWGPAAGRQTPQGKPEAVSLWIANATRWVEERYQPTLNLVYLPHLDYNLQRHGLQESVIQADVSKIDAIVGCLIDFYAQRSVETWVVSEYGIVDVRRPVFLNRVFRDKGWLRIREELGLELLDCGASRAFCVADHQVAHVYINDPSVETSVRETLEKTEGIAAVISGENKREWGLQHERSGDLIAVAEPDAWFAYYYWMEDSKAPDFARTVDIHRKPGYDPVELFLDPNLRFPKVKILRRLLQKRLGFRMLMDVIPLDATLVKGSHGVRPKDENDWPVLIRPKVASCKPSIDSVDVYHLMKERFS